MWASKGMGEKSSLSIEVAYAEPGRQIILSAKVPAGTSIWDAVLLSGIVQKVPTIDLENQAIGIYGKISRKAKEQQVAEGDRIEIYRPVNVSE